MKKNDVVEIRIGIQGSPIINNAWIVEVSKNIVLIEIDMKSKYCDVSATTSGSNGDCGIFITASERALFLKEDVDRELGTSITFPQFNGYRVYASNWGRYTIQLCLLKNKK